jgi:hypothetical protein
LSTASLIPRAKAAYSKPQQGQPPAGTNPVTSPKGPPPSGKNRG